MANSRTKTPKEVIILSSLANDVALPFYDKQPNGESILRINYLVRGGQSVLRDENEMNLDAPVAVTKYSHEHFEELSTHKFFKDMIERNYFKHIVSENINEIEEVAKSLRFDDKSNLMTREILNKRVKGAENIKAKYNTAVKTS
jgi:hypothetical protein